MSLLAEGLQPSVLAGIFKTAGRVSAIRVSDALTTKGAAYHLSFHNSTHSFESDFRDASYVSRVFAADSSRLSIASLQSVFEARRLFADKFALPWSLIQIYYAAFYAAHAIARILGGACCWLESHHIDRVRSSAAAVGIAMPFRVDAGNYQCRAIHDGTSIEWTKLNGKGTHESFWLYFEGVVRNAGQAILAGPVAAQDAQDAFAKLSDFLNFGAIRRSGYWMSRVRNEIQYQFEHGVWHPNDFTSREREALSRLAGEWTTDPMKIDLRSGSRLGDPGDLTIASAFLVSLCDSLLTRVAERGAGRTRSFVYFGPRNFLSQRCRHGS